MQTNSLAGKIFFTCQNNGIVALASETTVKNLTRRNDIVRRINQRFSSAAERALRRLNGRIFTFCYNADGEQLNKMPWFTADVLTLTNLRAYIERQGGKVEGGFFHVPFSTACETGLHGEEALFTELSFVTTDEDFVAEFGISIADLWAQRNACGEGGRL